MLKYPYILSVIIPVYNTELYLSQCVESVLNQTVKDIQIILVDDGSPDNAPALCDRLAWEYENIQVIHKENAGLGMARNTGLEVAQGKYVAFLDSDDYLENDYYEKLLIMAEDYRTDICYACGVTVQEARDQCEVCVASVETGVLISGNGIRELLPKMICKTPGTNDSVLVSACMCVFSRSFLIRNQLTFLSERIYMSEDQWFQMDCLNCAERIAYADVSGYIYRYNSESLSRGFNPERFKKLITSMRMLERKCVSLKLGDYEDRMAMCFWVNFEKCINQVIRFEKEHYHGIKIMVENLDSQRYLQRLSGNKQFRGLHGLLCRLLHKRMYFTTILCLRIYNLLVH